MHDSRANIGKVLTVFGTRPEVIKLAPVLRQLDSQAKSMQSIVVSSGQHTDLLVPFVMRFGIRIDYELQVMKPGQPLSELFARVLQQLDPVLEKERPDVVLVQGDTTTAVAAAVAAFHRKIPLGHVEAGLRTDDPSTPFPEETNRRLVTRLARWHFAATRRNVRTLLREGVPRDSISLTGNPVVDALHYIRSLPDRSRLLEDLLARTAGYQRITLTTHRRESFGDVMTGNLLVLRDFVERHPEMILIFPVHPNPNVRAVSREVLTDHSRIVLVDPLDYADFIGLLSESALIVSDSGGIQEEAPSLGKPLIVLREQTERPEVVEAGVAKLAGTPDVLKKHLAAWYAGGCGPFVPDAVNPFGSGDSGRRIVRVLERWFRERNRKESLNRISGS